MPAIATPALLCVLFITIYPGRPPVTAAHCHDIVPFIQLPCYLCTASILPACACPFCSLPSYALPTHLCDFVVLHFCTFLLHVLLFASCDILVFRDRMIVCTAPFLYL